MSQITFYNNSVCNTPFQHSCFLSFQKKLLKQYAMYIKTNLTRIREVCGDGDCDIFVDIKIDYDCNFEVKINSDTLTKHIPDVHRDHAYGFVLPIPKLENIHITLNSGRGNFREVFWDDCTPIPMAEMLKNGVDTTDPKIALLISELDRRFVQLWDKVTHERKVKHEGQ